MVIKRSKRRKKIGRVILRGLILFVCVLLMGVILGLIFIGFGGINLVIFVIENLF